MSVSVFIRKWIKVKTKDFRDSNRTPHKNIVNCNNYNAMPCFHFTSWLMAVLDNIFPVTCSAYSRVAPRLIFITCYFLEMSNS